MDRLFTVDYSQPVEFLLAAPRELLCDSENRLIRAGRNEEKYGHRTSTGSGLSNLIAETENLDFLCEKVTGVTYFKEKEEEIINNFRVRDADLYVATAYRLIINDKPEDMGIDTFWGDVNNKISTYIKTDIGDHYAVVTAAGYNPTKKVYRRMEGLHNLAYTSTLMKKPKTYVFIKGETNIRRLYDDPKKYVLKNLCKSIGMYVTTNADGIKHLLTTNGLGIASEMFNYSKNFGINIDLSKAFLKRVTAYLPEIINKIKEQDKDLITNLTALGINSDDLYNGVLESFEEACDSYNTVTLNANKGIEEMQKIICEGE